MYRRVSRNKSILLLALVLIASFMWMTSQAKRGQGAGPIERGVSLVSYPFVKAIGATTCAVRGVWQGYFHLVGLRAENKKLQKENGRLFLENARLRQEMAREHRFADLGAIRQDMGFGGVTASVIGRDATSWFKSVWIDKGEGAGVRRNMPAALYTGIVGRVTMTYGVSSRVLLITDPSSAVSCLTERTREPGILVGEGNGLCRLLYVGKHADVVPGDLIVTSGLDSIFPQGLPIGEVTRSSKASPGYFIEIEVKPTADISRLEELYLVSYAPPAIPKEEGEPSGKNAKK